jgi:hypothetical protein
MKGFVLQRSFTIFTALCLVWTGIGSELTAQPVTYIHPDYEMSFSASASWVEASGRNDEKVLRVINPNRNLEVQLSYFPGITHPKKQLKKISGQRGLICQGKSFNSLPNGRKSVLMRGSCLQGKRPFHRLITGIPGKEGLYVMEICCPEECYYSHRKEIEAILSSLTVGS